MGYSNKTFKLSRLENSHYPNVDQYNQTQEIAYYYYYYK